VSAIGSRDYTAVAVAISSGGKQAANKKTPAVTSRGQLSRPHTGNRAGMNTVSAQTQRIYTRLWKSPFYQSSPLYIALHRSPAARRKPERVAL